jgi:hypothetical protein
MMVRLVLAFLGWLIAVPAFAQIPCAGGVWANCPSPYYNTVSVLALVNTGPTTMGKWTTTGRPTSPTVGMTGLNTTTGFLETWTGSAWASGGGSSVTWPTTGQVVVSSGTNTPTGLPVGTSGTSTIVETTGGGLLLPAILPIATNAAYGASKCDNTTITCSSGVFTAVGATASSIGTSTTVSGGITSGYLFYVNSSNVGFNSASNLGIALSGANSNITSLSGLTTALSIAQGGTGATTAGAALTAFGGASTSSVTSAIQTAIPSATASQMYVGTSAAGAAAVVSTLPTALEPAFSGDVAKSAGSLATSVTNLSNVTNASLANSGLAHPSTTVNGQACTLGSTCTITASAGTISVGVTTVASGTANYLLSVNGAGTTLANVAVSSLSLAGSQIASGTISGSYVAAVNLAASGNGGVTGSLPYANLASLSANTVLGALTATTPSGLALPSCSGATNALTWTSGTGFGCNSITTGSAAAGSLTGTTLASNVVNTSITSTGTLTSGAIGSGFTAIPSSALAGTISAGSCTNCNLTYNAEGQITVAANGSSSGGVTSVSNSDGSVTISPNTGAVVASLNVGHINTFTANEAFVGGSYVLAGTNTGSSQRGNMYDLEASWLPASISGGQWSFMHYTEIDAMGLSNRTGSASDYWSDFVISDATFITTSSALAQSHGTGKLIEMTFANGLGNGCNGGACFTGSISGTTLTVSGLVSGGTIYAGEVLTGVGVTLGTTISSGSGSTWTVSPSQTVSSTSMVAQWDGVVAHMNTNYQEFTQLTTVAEFGSAGMYSESIASYNYDYCATPTASCTTGSTAYPSRMTNFLAATYKNSPTNYYNTYGFAAASVGTQQTTYAPTAAFVASGGWQRGIDFTGVTNIPGFVAIALPNQTAVASDASNLYFYVNNAGVFTLNTTDASFMVPMDYYGILPTGTATSAACFATTGSGATAVSDLVTCSGYFSGGTVSGATTFSYSGSGPGLTVTSYAEMQSPVYLSSAGGSGTAILGNVGNSVQLYYGSTMLANFNTSGVTLDTLPTSCSGQPTKSVAAIGWVSGTSPGTLTLCP